ncbi:MAG: cadmium-translocating P-type ATPase [Proteobacteria bacterium]|nr:cadmium-translocating P-type ATPase [Pseudomonadota bacterium]
MDCPSCVGKIEHAVSRLAGVQDVSVNLMTETLTARLETDEVAAEVTRALAALGYRISPQAAASIAVGNGSGDHKPDHGHAGDHAHGEEEEPGVSWWRTGKARLVWLLVALVAAAYLGSRLFTAEAYWIFVAATLIAVLPFGQRAIDLARAGSPFSIETLMCVAAVGAIFIGAAEEAAIVVLLFALGELLENVAAGRARAGIRALGALMPRTAQVERHGDLIDIPTDQLQAGEVVRVRPGDRIPSDGVVLEGHAAVDESSVTGESVPVSRGPGDPVTAATIATDAVLRIQVTAPAADNTISRIVRMVEEATASRAPTQRFIERFSEYWTPGAMAVAALIILIPPLAFGGEWAIWIYRGLSVLLIACPCALVISVPAAMASGLSAGARRGLLIKGGAALERLGEARTMAFDKTGTLTAGKPRVTDVIATPGTDENAVIRLAAAVEAGSAHPLARAILDAAEAKGIQPPPASEAAAVAGKAATALVEEQRVSVGSPRYATEVGAVLPDTAAIERLEAEGKTVVVVLAENRIVGLVALRDEPRPDAAAGIEALRGMGLSCVMLTGDNTRTGRAIAASLNMDVRAQLLPEQKLQEIEALKTAGPVVMIGDGINDAPALAAASVGVAMGGGTAVALETADAALLGERVTGAAELIALSRATIANVKLNVAIAVGLKLLFLATTMTGITGLWMAILADTGATVFVTTNALRLLRWRSPFTAKAE